MKQHKKIRGILSLVMALLMMASVLCCTASAANNNSSALSQALSQAIANQTKATNTALLTSVSRPTPNNPLTYAYTVKVTAYDPIGRAVVGWYNYIDFYTSKADMDANQQPIYSHEFRTDDKGQATVSYIETFTQTPPANLYYKIRPRANVRYYPSEGYAPAQIYLDD